MSIKSVIRKKVKEILLQERIKIKDVTRNPPGSKHDVTVFAEISPTIPAQVGGEGNERSNALLSLRSVRNYPEQAHSSLKKDIVIQGDFIENDEGMKTLRLKLYDKDIPAPYQRPPGWKPVTLLTKLRSLNLEELVPYDEGGIKHDSLEPTPPEIEVPKAPKRPEDPNKSSKKRKTKRTVPNRASEDTPVVAMSITNEEKGQILDLLRKSLIIAMRNKNTEFFQKIQSFVQKINSPITNINEGDLLSSLAEFFNEIGEYPDMQIHIGNVIRQLVNIKARNVNNT